MIFTQIQHIMIARHDPVKRAWPFLETNRFPNVSGWAGMNSSLRWEHAGNTADGAVTLVDRVG